MKCKPDDKNISQTSCTLFLSVKNLLFTDRYYQLQLLRWKKVHYPDIFIDTFNQTGLFSSESHFAQADKFRIS